MAKKKVFRNSFLEAFYSAYMPAKPKPKRKQKDSYLKGILSDIRFSKKS